MYWLIDENNQQVVFSSKEDNIIKLDGWGEYDCPDGCDDFYREHINNSIEIKINKDTTEITVYPSTYCMVGFEKLIFDNKMQLKL